MTSKTQLTMFSPEALVLSRRVPGIWKRKTHNIIIKTIFIYKILNSDNSHNKYVQVIQSVTIKCGRIRT